MRAQMRRLGATFAVTGLVLLAGCGGDSETEPEAGDFDPVVAEGYVRDKARADVRSNPVVAIQNPEDPVVNCREDRSPPDDVPEDAGQFTCGVTITARDGTPLGSQTWEVVLARTGGGGDTDVRSARRASSTVGRAPLPEGSSSG